MNKERLLKARNFLLGILSEEEKAEKEAVLDMDLYYHSCGYPACVAGWLTVDDEMQEWIKEVAYEANIYKGKFIWDNGLSCPEYILEEVFDLSWDESSYIFGDS